jgi:L-threonylcarbamoyladenylate synthase
MVKPQFLSTCSADSIQKAAEQLKAGHLVAFPTETVYGLGADATNEQSVKRIYEVKGRPTGHPLIVHVSSLDILDIWVKDVPDYAIELAQTFWPGPMTLILHRMQIAKNFITGGQDSVGIRIPSDPVALELLTRFELLGGFGVAAPSANRFGQVSPTSASDVEEEIGKHLTKWDSILNGGSSQVGIESTIIGCTTERPKILRPGAITKEMIKEATKLDLSCDVTNIRVSGSLENHYSPSAQVVLDIAPVAGDGFIASSEIPTPDGVIRLASPVSNEDFARVLYAALRSGDQQSLTRVVVKQPSGDNIGLAIRDRLSRASRGR